MGSADPLPKKNSHTSKIGNTSKFNALFIQELDSHTSFLDTVKGHVHRSKLECPRFEGYDFLGWHMKVEQYFEVIGTQKGDKIQTVMIHLDG